MAESTLVGECSRMSLDQGSDASLIDPKSVQHAASCCIRCGQRHEKVDCRRVAATFERPARDGLNDAFRILCQTAPTGFSNEGAVA